MSEFKQVPLGAYVGRWKFVDNKNYSKYYSVIPEGNKFRITWGKNEDELNSKKFQIIIEDSEEVYRRILSKARMGYEIYAQVRKDDWTPKCFDEYDAISEVVELAKEEYRKRRPRKRAISLLEWIEKKDEYRENDTW